MIIAIIVLVIIVVLVILAVVGFNKLRQADVSAQEALGGIDVQLTRRADLVPNLVETVKGYAKHESGVFQAVTEARAQVNKAAATGTVEEKATAEAALDKSLINVMAVAEQYPDLPALVAVQRLGKGQQARFLQGSRRSGDPTAGVVQLADAERQCARRCGHR